MSDDDVRIISPSSASSISILINETIPSSASPTLISPSGNVPSAASSISISSPSSSSEPSSYTSERIYHLLKYEKHQYDVIDNKAPIAILVLIGLFLVFKPNSIKKRMILKELWVLLVVVSVKRLLYMVQIVEQTT
jgi:hypothetical protein